MLQANVKSKFNAFGIGQAVFSRTTRSVLLALLAWALSAGIAGLLASGCSSGSEGDTLVVSPLPNSVTAGVAFTVTVTAYDKSGVDPCFNDTVQLTSSDSNAVLPANYQFTTSTSGCDNAVSGPADNGVHQFTLTLNTVGPQTITATDSEPGNGGVKPGSTTVTVAAETVAAKFLVSAPASATSGTAFTTTITAQDANGNTVTGYTGTVAFTSSDSTATVPANYTFTSADSGVHTFTDGFTLQTLGNQTITATDTTTASITGSATVNVVSQAQTVTQYVLSGPSTANQGAPFSVTVTAASSTGSAVASYTGTVHFTSSDTAAVLPANYTFTAADAGVHMFTNGFTLNTTGAQSITATDTVTSSITGGVSLIVQGPVLQSITVTPNPATVVPGGTLQFTATGNYSNNTTQNLTTQVTWASSNMSVAAISNTAPNQGLATAGTMTGSTTISATFGSGATAIVGTATLIVQQGYVSTASRYLLDLSQNNISVDAIVPGTGQLRAVGMAQINTSVNYPMTILGIPGTFVVYYVSIPTFGLEIDTYGLGATGQLVDLQVPVSSQNYTGTPLPDPLGRFLYVEDSNGSIVVFQLNQLVGNPTSPATALSGLSIVGPMTIDPTGSYMFLENETGYIQTYGIDSSSGVLTQVGSPVNAPSAIYQMAVAPSGKLLFVFGSGGITVYSISSGALTEVTDSPFSVPSSGTPEQFAIDPSSSYLYLTEHSTDGLYGYTIAANGALTAMQSGSSFPVGQTPGPINIGAEGQYVYVNNRGSGDIWVYSIASGTGLLTPASVIRTQGALAQMLDTGAAGLTFTPESLFVATGTLGNGSVSQYTIDPSTGNLSSLAPEVGAGGEPQTVATDPYGQYAYVPDLGSPGTVYGYNISNSAGLSLFSGDPFASGNGPSWLTTDLSASFLYVTMQTDNTIWKYDLTSGVPGTGTSTVGAQTGPDFIVGDPSGQFMLAGATNPNGGAPIGSVQSLKISLPQGSLSGVTTYSQGLTSAKSIAVDPSGRYVYVADPTLNLIWEFTLSSEGALAINSSNPSSMPGPSGAIPGPSSIVIEPSGKYLYATNESLGQIFAFSIDPSTGVLSDVHTTMDDSQVANTDPSPVALAVDISGKYLYCVNLGTNGSGTIDIFSIDLTTGFLTSVGSTSNVPAPGGLVLTGVSR